MYDQDEKQEMRQQLINLASDDLDIYHAAHSWFVDQRSEITMSLIEGLDDERLGSVCHWRILLLLRHFVKEETLPAILKAFHRALALRDPIVLPGAMEALAVFHTPAATNALIALLQESNLDIVKHAAALVGRTGDLNAIEPLLRLLSSDNPSIRYSAARGLIQLDSPSVRDALERHLEKETNMEVRELIISERAGGTNKSVH